MLNHLQTVRFKSPDYSSQRGKRFTKQNKKVLISLNRKIFQHASKLLQSHWPRRYFLYLHISKQKIICRSILSWPVGFEKKNWSSCLMHCYMFNHVKKTEYKAGFLGGFCLLKDRSFLILHDSLSLHYTLVARNTWSKTKPFYTWLLRIHKIFCWI